LKNEYHKKFATRLLKWNKEKNDRQMPWKGEKDPYKIWLSEIILQQTRVEQGMKYYQKFIKKFPDVHKLANANDANIFKLWEGLGYYSRCKNLIYSARHISKTLKGKFPETYETIYSLKGVGSYTASAIASFAYELPYAVLDGNVYRVLSRVFGISTSIDSSAGKKVFSNLANELLDMKKPAVYNQAIMDFGAVVCKPSIPLCSTCYFNKSCFAYLNNRVNELPVKEKSIRIKKRWFYYLVLENRNDIIIRQRSQKDIWQQLFEFPLIEMIRPTNAKKVIQYAQNIGWLKEDNYKVVSISAISKQKLSHQLISGQFIRIRLNKRKKACSDWQWLEKNNLSKITFPKLINQYLQQGG